MTGQSTLNFVHDLKRDTPTATHIDLLPSPKNHREPTANAPTPAFNIIAETPTSFTRFDRIKIEDLKKEIISETERTIAIHFGNELAAFKEKCEKLIALTYENSKISNENLEKETTRKDNSRLITSLINFY